MERSKEIDVKNIISPACNSSPLTHRIRCAIKSCIISSAKKEVIAAYNFSIKFQLEEEIQTEGVYLEWGPDFHPIQSRRVRALRVWIRLPLQTYPNASLVCFHPPPVNSQCVNLSLSKKRIFSQIKIY